MCSMDFRVKSLKPEIFYNFQEMMLLSFTFFRVD